MKVISGGNEFIEQLTMEQIDFIKATVNIQINKHFDEDIISNSGFMMLGGTKKSLEYDRVYLEYFFNRDKDITGVTKIILYDGDEPDEVLDAINEVKKNNELTIKNIS